jgi:hypothetical protein
LSKLLPQRKPSEKLTRSIDAWNFGAELGQKLPWRLPVEVVTALDIGENAQVGARNIVEMSRKYIVRVRDLKDGPRTSPRDYSLDVSSTTRRSRIVKDLYYCVVAPCIAIICSP